MSRRRLKPMTELGQCYVCGKAESRIRYFVAVPLPEIMYLCQDVYASLMNSSFVVWLN